MKTIYYNGAVYTGQLPLAEAFVEESGVFTFAGSNEEAVKMAESGDRLVDLKGNLCAAASTTATCTCWDSEAPCTPQSWRPIPAA